MKGGRESRVTAEDEEAAREESERDGERRRKLLMLTRHQWCWVLFQAGRKFTLAPVCVSADGQHCDVVVLRGARSCGGGVCPATQPAR